jgi:uncharacterized protein YjbJ (UPF0337 family)
MDWDIIAGSWKEIKGKVHEKWGRITNDELDVIDGKREQLEGTIQRVYGKTKDEVKKEVDEFARSCEHRDD